MTNAITLDNVKSYATEANLDKALAKLGLDDYSMNGCSCKYFKVCTADGRWTAIFMVSGFFSLANCGGYIGFASQHGFVSV